MNRLFDKVIAYLAVVLLLFQLTGCFRDKTEQPSSVIEEVCSSPEPSASEPESEASGSEEKPSRPHRPAVSRPVSRPEKPSSKPVSEEVSAPEPAREIVLRQEHLALAFSRLGSMEKEVYRRLFGGISRMDTAVKIQRVTEDVKKDVQIIERVYSCIRADYPEIFYVRGISYEVHSDYVSICPRYTGDRRAVEKQTERVRKAADRWLETADRRNDYQKSKWVYEQVIRNTRYGGPSKDGQTIESVFLRGESVCAGYAASSVYLLHRLGIPAAVVHGKVQRQGREETENHAWVLERLNHTYCCSDPTWGESSQFTGSVKQDGLTYAYLNVNDEMLSAEERHIPERNGFSVPRCISDQSSYFVTEGLNLGKFQEDTFARAVMDQLNKGQFSMTIRLHEEPEDVWKGQAGAERWKAMQRAVRSAIENGTLSSRNPDDYEISLSAYSGRHLVELSVQRRPIELSDVPSETASK